MKKHSKNTNFYSKIKHTHDFEKLRRVFSIILLLLFVFSSSNFCMSPLEIEVEVEVELLQFEENNSKDSKKSNFINFENDDYNPICHFFEFSSKVSNILIPNHHLNYLQNHHLFEIPIPPPEYL